MDYDKTRRTFRQGFARDRHDLVLFRAPGRVNLIGEHTDYNGLPVLPIALQKEIVVAVTPRDDARIAMSNINPAYRDTEFVASASVEPAGAGDWSNYCRAAVVGLWECVTQRAGTSRRVTGMNLMVDGDIPVAAGLSSSSAMVVACALAFLHVNGLRVRDNGGDGIGRIELAELLAQAEQFVGTRGGGMDQTVSLCARKGAALKIDFFPIRVTAVPLPEGYRFVVANSMVRAEKSARQRDLYNRGPWNCHAAAAIAARHFKSTSSRPIERLGDLTSENTRLDREEIWHRLEVALSREAPELLSFVRHVIAEGARVDKAVDALGRMDMHAFGALMSESHASLRDGYGVSCPELDALVDIAMASGAIGSRLTGAGFGGCTVNLVPDSAVGEFVEQLGSRYYLDYLRKRRPDLAPSLDALTENIVVCEPADRAGEANF